MLRFDFDFVRYCWRAGVLRCGGRLLHQRVLSSGINKCQAVSAFLYISPPPSHSNWRTAGFFGISSSRPIGRVYHAFFFSPVVSNPSDTHTQTNEEREKREKMPEKPAGNGEWWKYKNNRWKILENRNFCRYTGRTFGFICLSTSSFQFCFVFIFINEMIFWLPIMTIVWWVWR